MTTIDIYLSTPISPSIICLFPEAAFWFDITLRPPCAVSLVDTHDWLPGAPRVSRDDRFPLIAPRLPEHPVPVPLIFAQHLYDDLVARYGPTHGKRIYFEMEAGMKGPFAPGKEYDASVRPIQPGLPAPSFRKAPVRRVPPAKRN